MRKTFTAILVVLTILLLASCASTQAQKKVSGAEYLSLWTEDAPLRNELIAYMEAITDPSSPDYIPVEDRIAVFDFDGTLFCETDPNYFDYTLLLYRVTEDTGLLFSNRKHRCRTVLRYFMKWGITW